MIVSRMRRDCGLQSGSTPMTVTATSTASVRRGSVLVAGCVDGPPSVIKYLSNDSRITGIFTMRNKLLLAYRSCERQETIDGFRLSPFSPEPFPSTVTVRPRPLEILGTPKIKV